MPPVLQITDLSTHIQLTKSVVQAVGNVDLSIELQVMSFYLSHRGVPGAAPEWSPLPHAVGLTSSEPG